MNFSQLASMLDTADTTSIGSLPAEIIMLIATKIGDEKSLNALACSSTWTYNLVHEILYRKNAINGASAVYWGAEHNVISTMKKALNAGADVDAMQNDKTSLMIAVFKGNMEAAEFLLASNANINIVDRSGRTALDFVGPRYLQDRRKFARNHYRPNDTVRMRPSKLAMMELLLVNGASPDFKGMGDRALLHEAVMNQDDNTIELLLRHGAEKNSVDFANMSPLCTAINLRNPDGSFNLNPARLLLAWGSLVTGAGSDGFAPIHVAAYHGNVGGLGLLIEYGSDVSGPNPKGNTPLQVAIKAGHKQFAHALLEAGAVTDIDQANYPGRPPSRYASPLRLALGLKSLHLFRQILAHDADERVRRVFDNLRFEEYQKDAHLILARKGLDSQLVKITMVREAARRLWEAGRI